MTEKEFGRYMWGFALGFIVAVVVMVLLHHYSPETCRQENKACRIQTCARLVVEGGVTHCEEWKP